MPDGEGLIAIAAFNEPVEAEMARTRLESAGIEVFLRGENARILEPGLGDLSLLVAPENAADARAILADSGDAAPPFGLATHDDLP